MAPTLTLRNHWTAILALLLGPVSAHAQAPASQPASAPASQPASVPAPALVQPARVRPGPPPLPEKSWLDDEGDVADAPVTATRERSYPEQAWAGSRITWGHDVWSPSDIGLTPGPRYYQLLAVAPVFRPLPGLRLGLRAVLAFALTSEDAVDDSRSFVERSSNIDFEQLSGPTVLATDGGPSDVHLDAAYSPELLTIPVLGVRVEPGLRLVLPLSHASRSRTRRLGLAPGLALRRRFELLRGFWLPALELVYAFRGYKYFHENGIPIESGPNTSWHLENAVEAQLELLRGLHLALGFHRFDDLLYERDPFSSMESPTNHRALHWLVLDLRYEVLRWLWVAAGMSWLSAQQDEGGYRSLAVVDETRFHVNLTLPVDRLVTQIRSWSGASR